MRTRARWGIVVTASAVLAAALWLTCRLGYSHGRSASSRDGRDRRLVTWSPGFRAEVSGETLHRMAPGIPFSDARPYSPFGHATLSRKNVDVRRPQGVKNVVDVIVWPFPPLPQ